MKLSQASVTVFLALVFLLLLSFLCTLLESIRIHIARVYEQMALASAVESVAAGYCRELFEEYGLLFYWPGEKLPAEEAEKYFSYYVDADQGLPINGINLYRLSAEQLQIQDIIRAGDYNARALRQQMLDTACYDGIDSLLTVLQGQLGLLERGEELREELEQAKSNYEETDWSEYRLPAEAEAQLPSQEEAASEKLAQEKEWKKQLDESFHGSLIEQLWQWLRYPLLMMVLPDNTQISSEKVETDRLEAGFADETEAFESLLGSALLEQIIINEYVLENTASFLDPVGSDGLQYEIEYVLCGEADDEKNLNGTVQKLLLTREGLNLLWLMQDPHSLEQAGLLADSLVGWTMMPVLIGSVKLAVLSAWAYAESVVDVRALLTGERVPLLKDVSTWEVTMERIPLLISGQKWERDSERSGLSYTDYLRLLMLTQSEQVTVDRMVGLIQYHMNRLNAGFYLRDCISEAQFILTAELANGFLRFPVGNVNGADIYNITLYQEFSYEMR